MSKKGIFNWFKELFIQYDSETYDADDLTAAILTGNIEEVSKIIDSGVDPDSPDDLCRLPIHFASEKNKAEIIELMVNKGADIHLLDELGNTALMCGAQMDAQEACRKLLYLGIDYFLTDNKGNTALEIAITAQHQKIINLFWERLNELNIIISKSRNEQAAKYSDKAEVELGVVGVGAGGRTQFSKKDNFKILHFDKKSLPELELEAKRLEKMLKKTGVKPG
ncbi:MAG: ankyrin repeat domain-containing protein [Bacteroidota bacterium]